MARDPYDLSDLGGKIVGQEDKYDLSDLGGKLIGEEPKPSSFLSSLGRTLGGVGESLVNQVVNIANLPSGLENIAFSGMPKGFNKEKPLEIPQAKFGEGTAHDVGNIIGDIVGMGYVGKGAKAATTAAEKFPNLVGKIAEKIGQGGLAGTGGRAAGYGAYGALQSPEDMLRGAGLGAGISLGADVLGKGISKAFGAVRPLKHAKDIMHIISGGGKSTTESAKNLASTIASTFAKKAEEASKPFQEIKDIVGDAKIYSGITPEKQEIVEAASKYMGPKGNIENIKSQLGVKEEGKYLELPKEITKKYDLDLKDLHKEFLSNPTFENAHSLYKQLGHEVRDFQKKAKRSLLPESEKKTMQAYKRAQDSLSTDIKGLLEKTEPGLGKKFEEANRNWFEEISPYTRNPLISEIAKGNKKNIGSNIKKIFKEPEEDIEKIVSDLPSEARNQIVHSVFGKLSKRELPEHLLEKKIALENAGLGHYVSPELEKSFEKLESKLFNRKLAQKASGSLLGGVTGSKFGPLGAIPGSATGAMLFPKIAEKLSPITEALSNVSSPVYTLIKQALMGNLINSKKEKR